MKKFKIIMGLLALTTILSINNIKASGVMTYVDIKIPSMQGIYTTEKETKNTISEQYIYTVGAVDYLSGDDRVIGARLKDITTSYMIATEGRYVQLDSSNTSLGATPGEYQLQLKANKWTMSAVHYTGTWYLDENLLPRK
ncbi:MAG: hypothetical protein HFJ12_03715 [Bacilli bacterium]|nr:hypothetical protein [Bacilli bacterium]MCI8778247.1 hypothetical protein [Bacilli bacterium]